MFLVLNNFTKLLFSLKKKTNIPKIKIKKLTERFILRKKMKKGDNK